MKTGEGWGYGAGSGAGEGYGEGALISHSWDLLLANPEQVDYLYEKYVVERVTSSWWFDLERNELTCLRLAHEPLTRFGFILLSAEEALDWL